MSQIRTIALIDNVNMGRGHDGLTLIAKKFGVHPERLKDGEILMFLNRKRDKLKILGKQGTVIGYLRMPKERVIDLGAIQYIPQCFGSSGQLDYDAALRKALTDRLEASRRRPIVNPLQAYREAREAGV